MKPTNVTELMREATRHLKQGRFAEALAAFDKARVHKPRDAAVHEGRADALHGLNRLPDAIAAYDLALSLDATRPMAWWGLGCARKTRNEYAPAAVAFRRLTELDPANGHGWHNLGTTLHELGEADAAWTALQKAAELLPEPEISLSLIATLIPGVPSATATDIRTAREKWAAFYPVKERPPLAEGLPNRPIRVGYLSSFYMNRNWMKPVWALVNAHDREDFAITLISEGPLEWIKDGYRRDNRDGFLDIQKLDNPNAAKRIAELNLDILVDLNAYSRQQRLPLYTLRPAPIQVTWFNTYATTGFNCFDAVIADETTVLPGDEALCSEARVERVTGSYLTFGVNYPVPDVAPSPYLSGKPFTFGCFAPQYKINAPMLDVFARILQGAPGSRLVLKNRAFSEACNREYMANAFRSRGIAPERVELDGPAEHFEFLKKYAAIDLTLESFPYNGGTTTMESLWQGVPVLTYRGKRWTERIGAAMILAAQLPEFVAEDADEFVRRAIAFANTPSRLSELRPTLREQVSRSPLCHATGFARQMEAIYRRLVGVS